MQKSTSIKLLIAGFINGIILPFVLFWIMDENLGILMLFLPGFFFVSLNRIALIPNYTPKHTFIKMLPYGLALSVLVIIIIVLFGTVAFGELENQNLFSFFSGFIIFPILIQFFHLHFKTKNDIIALFVAALVGIFTGLIIQTIFNLPKGHLKFVNDFIREYQLFNYPRYFPEFLISSFFLSMIINLLIIITNITSKYRTMICILFVFVMFALMFDVYQINYL